ncbi:L,D-transpeptidase family protein [Verrucomicrobiales bacterium BCK34]|nr:L,D-transpeptidase family protein [Verrucomicrobiales bacterium BCK34]
MNLPFSKCAIPLLGVSCTFMYWAQSQDSATGSSNKPLIIAVPVVDTPAPPSDGRAPMPAGLKISTPASEPEDEIDPTVGVTTSMAPAATAPLPPVEPVATQVSPEFLAVRNQVLSAFPSTRHFKTVAADVIATIYQQRGFRPLWDPKIDGFLFKGELSGKLAEHAFPELMVSDPEIILSAITDETVDKGDLALTIAFCDTALLIRMGAVPTESIWEDWNKEDTPGSADFSVESIVGDLVTATSLQPANTAQSIEIMAPKNWIYRELLKAYPEAKASILEYSGLPNIPDPASSGVARPGEAYPYAPALAAHLVDRGYLTMPAELMATLSSMTPELTAALVAFQGDYGLDTDGIFGSGSWQYLNTNAADRYRSIILNLHRARLIPNKMGKRYVIANLPSAELYAFDENDFHMKTMRVVHGRASKESHRTRIFRDTMKEVVFGPYWNVPKSIAVKEILPKAQEDWGFLSRNRYEIVSSFNPYDKSSHRLSPANLELVSQGRLFLRQKPGPTNSLGRIKFLFPNSFNIYMHDTPSKSYFARSERDHSHGCVRVSKPEEFGEWVLSSEGWTGEQVKTAMYADERKSHAIKTEINVYIIYLTTFPRPIDGGKIVLAPARDVYELDPVLSRTLGEVTPWTE